MGKGQALEAFLPSSISFQKCLDWLSFPGSRGNIGAEQEIVQAVGVQNAVDDHFAFDDFKVNAVIFGDVAIKNFTILFHLAETGVIQGLEGGF